VSDWVPTPAERRAARAAAYIALRRGHVPAGIEIDDLEQIALIALWRTAEKRAGLATDINSALKQARWAIYTELRNIYTERRNSRERPEEDHDVEPAAPDADPEASARVSEALALLDRRMTPQQRRVLIAVLESDTQADAARLLGTSPQSVSAHIQALKRLVERAVG